MTIDEKIQLITRKVEETLTVEELKILLEKKPNPRHYIGYEISGRVHIGQGLFTLMKIKDLQDAGVETTILLADWHTWLNKKLDGTLETASRLGTEYLAEAMRAGALCVGADPEKINFVLGSEFLKKRGPDYWATVVKVAKATTLARMLRSTTIMGRKEDDVTESAMLIYPAMQSADIFELGADIAHAGTDQRNVHVVARDAAKELGFDKPIAIHTTLLQGLLPPVITKNEKTGEDEMDLEAAKMSKSKPDSGIYMSDSPEEITRKINNAYAPEGVIKFNPILNWTKYLIFYYDNSTFSVDRPEKWGGPLTYTTYEALENAYAAKELHPQDLKAAVARWLIEKLAPAREYFEDPKRKAALEEITALTAKK